MTRGSGAFLPVGRSLLTPVILLLAFAGWLDVSVHHRSLLHALLVSGVAGLGGVAAWAITRRNGLAAVATATIAVWSLPHLVSQGFLWAALAVGAGMFLRFPSRLLEALIGFAGAGVLAHFLFETPLAVLVAAFAAGGIILVRPEAPTEGVLRFLRFGALFLPAAGMVLALLINAATQRAEKLPAADAVFLGAALAGLWGLVSLAFLGLGTLLESREPRQEGAWASLGLGASLLVASFSNLRPDDLLPTFAVMAVPLGALAALASVRLASTWPRPRHLFSFLAVVASGMQWGLRI